jgi:hypothetical protein
LLNVSFFIEILIFLLTPSPFGRHPSLREERGRG